MCSPLPVDSLRRYVGSFSQLEEAGEMLRIRASTEWNSAGLICSKRAGTFLQWTWIFCACSLLHPVIEKRGQETYNIRSACVPIVIVLKLCRNTDRYTPGYRTNTAHSEHTSGHDVIGQLAVWASAGTVQVLWSLSELSTTGTHSSKHSFGWLNKLSVSEKGFQ